ncbi:hypothetical protein [Actinomycetospora termitidis]|uniref:Uncharacterized protein n=1 Tax=Actinomycetospora termitidis TaxID=3053470 RepID=A0ABT7M8L2_9PSEU|nr:hypothetical protein [Actinomycetospora sp. Odt1-22]MDL5157005.1 hypothetical protein [Actinomycetospora sp. Odt1-22]
MRLLTAIQDPPYVDRHALGERLLEFHYPEGGWGTRAIGRRPEATAVVIDALERIGATFDIDEALHELATMLSESDRQHTYVLVEALSTTARLRPTSDLARELAAHLLANRDARSLAWPEKRPAVPGAVPRPSTAHTARALTVLSYGLERGLDDPDGEYLGAIESGQRWLEENANLAPIRENVEPEGQRDLEIRHFTPALVAHALASVRSPSWDLLARALAEVWRSYNSSIERWQWPNGDVPVWLQLDALRAVTAAHARQTMVPIEGGEQ